MGTWTKRRRSAVGPVAVFLSLLVGLPVLTACEKSDGTAPDTTRPRRAPRPTTTVPATTPKNPLIIGLVTGKLDPLVRQGMENSARLAVRHANDDNRTPDWRIELVIVEDTKPEAVAKAVRKLALRKEAHFQKNFYCKGEWTDSVIYAVLEDEWATRTPPTSK